MNNPFGTPNSVVNSTANRFPVIDIPSETQQQQQQQFDINQQFQQQQPNLIQQQQQNYNYNQNQQQSYIQQNNLNSNGFIPQTNFGQQLSSQITGYQNNNSIPFQSGQSQQFNQLQQFNNNNNSNNNNNNGLNQSNLPQTTSNNFLDLDPYSNSNSNSNSNLNQQQQQSPAQFQSYSQIDQRVSHPRQFVQQEKNLLMAWDDYAWKQLLSRLDSLREGWEARKQQLLELSRRGGDPTQVDHLDREATSNIDSIHASKLQLSEVQSGWKFSTDVASKARVRESLNAGLSSLPEYPPVLLPEQIGGAFHQRAHEEARKQNIMSGFAPQTQSYGQSPQMQQLPMQQQFTGYPQQQQQFQYQQPQNSYPQQSNQQSSNGFQSQQPTGYYQQQQY